MPAHGQDVGIDLYWLPLGAGGSCVRLNGRMYEAVLARAARRPAQDLYHSALVVQDHGQRWVIEMAPVWSGDLPEHGVVCEGPVGARLLSRSRWFRYEVRLWEDGRIPDVAYAVDSPCRLSSDRPRVSRLLQILPTVPTLTWGRDQLGAGDMWNSNSLISWLLASSDHDMARIHPPAQGRAPGWQAGLALAARQLNARDHAE